MRCLLVNRIVLLGSWFAALGVAYIIGSRHADAAPSACDACACQNMGAQKAVGANAAGPTAYVRKNDAGGYDWTTHAFASCLAKGCGDPGPVETTQIIYSMSVDTQATC